MYKHRSQRISPRHTEYWDLISSECTNIRVKKYHPGIPNTGISSPLNVQTQESENITQAYVVLGSHLLWMYKHRSQRISPRVLISSIHTNIGVREYHPGIQSTGISFPLYIQTQEWEYHSGVWSTRISSPLYIQTQESENITQAYGALGSHLLWMYKHRSQRISPRYTEYWDHISSECTNIGVREYHPGIPNTGISTPLNVQT